MMTTNFLFLLLILILAIISIIFLVQRRERIKKELSSGRAIDSFQDPIPDEPIPFGYKCSWYLVRTTETEHLSSVFGLKRTAEVNWEKGIEAAYQGFVFISPPVDGWTFVVSTNLAQSRIEKITQKAASMLQKLSSAFGEAQFYATHRVVELHIWAKALNGKLIRAHGYIGESGEIFWDEGKAEVPEVDIRSDINEETVMEMARAWSISPTDLDQHKSKPSLGLVGEL